jgi:uncharacterized membrane protein YgdD (TMEM256/DUF423 family)
MNWTSASALALALGVILGAFGAHELRGKLDAYLMSIYDKAVLYHFIHSLGALVASLMAKTGALTDRAAGWVCALLLSGVAIFSGSLYILAITGRLWLGAVTPIGGLAFIAGWLALAWSALRK